MNEENFVQKCSHTTHYTDIVISVLGYFNLNHPVYLMMSYRVVCKSRTHMPYIDICYIRNY